MRFRSLSLQFVFVTMMMMMQGHMDDGMSASRIYQIYIDMIVEREDTKHTHPPTPLCVNGYKMD